MRTWTLVPCLLALAGLAAPAARAELVCPAPNFQAGQLKSGKGLVHRFSLVNRGSQAVDIVEIKPGCGCLKAQIDRNRFTPGSVGTLAVEINTVTQAAGPNTWKVTVNGTQAGLPFSLPLTIQADLQADVTIQPATLVVYTDRTISHAFTLIEHRTGAMKILAVDTGLPHFRAHPDEPAGEPGKWTRRINLEVLPACPDGRHEDVLQLHTSDPECPELKVPFTVVKRSPNQVRPSPPTVEWLAVGKQPLPARLVILGTGGEEVVEIERVVTSHPCLNCTWASGPGPRATLGIRLDRESMKESTLEGKVEVHIKKPTPQVVTVPVRCLSR